jgi:hypothetical protein
MLTYIDPVRLAANQASWSMIVKGKKPKLPPFGANLALHKPTTHHPSPMRKSEDLQRYWFSADHSDGETLRVRVLANQVKE